MKKSVIIFLIVSIIALSIVQAVSSNMLSTSGAEISKISRDLQARKRENIVMREKLFLYASLNNIAKKASKMGYAEARSQFVVSKSLPLAIRQ